MFVAGYSTGTNREQLWGGGGANVSDVAVLRCLVFLRRLPSEAHERCSTMYHILLCRSVAVEEAFVCYRSGIQFLGCHVLIAYLVLYESEVMHVRCISWQKFTRESSGGAKLSLAVVSGENWDSTTDRRGTTRITGKHLRVLLRAFRNCRCSMYVGSVFLQ